MSPHERPISHSEWAKTSEETNLFKVAETLSWIAAFQLYPPFEVT